MDADLKGLVDVWKRFRSGQGKISVNLSVNEVEIGLIVPVVASI